MGGALALAGRVGISSGGFDNRAGGVHEVLVIELFEAPEHNHSDWNRCDLCHAGKILEVLFMRFIACYEPTSPSRVTVHLVTGQLPAD